MGFLGLITAWIRRLPPSRVVVLAPRGAVRGVFRDRPEAEAIRSALGLDALAVEEHLVGVPAAGPTTYGPQTVDPRCVATCFALTARPCSHGYTHCCPRVRVRIAPPGFLADRIDISVEKA